MSDLNDDQRLTGPQAAFCIVSEQWAYPIRGVRNRGEDKGGKKLRSLGCSWMIFWAKRLMNFVIAT